MQIWEIEVLESHLLVLGNKMQENEYRMLESMASDAISPLVFDAAWIHFESRDGDPEVAENLQVRLRTIVFERVESWLCSLRLAAGCLKEDNDTG